MKVKNKRQRARGEAGFVSGVLLLSLSTLFVKIIGLAFKIPMLGLLGAAGMGYFNSAYEVYALLCVISTAGLPVALSIQVSAARAGGDVQGIRRAYRGAHRLFLAFGAAGSGVMLLFSEPIAKMLGNPQASVSIAAIAPALLFICLASAVRGYCQGFANMLPTAISQLIEALCKLVLGILFARLAAKAGLGTPYVSAAAIFGISVGCFLSLVYLLVAKAKMRWALRELTEVGIGESVGGLRALVFSALPITLAASVLSLTRIADMVLIMHRLTHIGISSERANIIYGAYTTMALPVFSLIPALITPVAMALVPGLSAAKQRGDGAGEALLAENALRLTVLPALPASLGLCAFAGEALTLLFGNREQEIELVAPLLALLGGSVVFSCLITTTNAILQANGHTCIPIVSMGVGVAVKLLVSYILIGTRGVEAAGAPIGSFCCSLCAAALNLFFIVYRCKYRPNLGRVLLKPLMAAAPAVGAAMFAYRLLCASLDMPTALVLAVSAAALVYLLLLPLLGGVSAEDIRLLPFGERLFNKISKRKKEI